MKQLIQNYKTGTLEIVEVPLPAISPNQILVRTLYSAISVGTERTKIIQASKSLVGKALYRPDLVQQVVDNFRQEGLLPTIEKVRTRLDTPITLGYSSSGEILQTGSAIHDLSIGQHVACFGETYACHAEYTVVPRSFCVPLPPNVHPEAAAFGGIGAIALQGVRQCSVHIGDRVVVIGLGLIGLLACQILTAQGCQVIGFDILPSRVNVAKGFGVEESWVCSSVEEALTKAGIRNKGGGVDAVLLTAASRSSTPLEIAGALVREKGTVVVLGAVETHIPRKDYYEKELGVVFSRAFGPGTYDPGYSNGVQDYPYGYVRWTAQRNVEEFLRLISLGKVNVERMITHRLSFQNALAAYDLLKSNSENPLGIVLSYDSQNQDIGVEQQTIRLGLEHSVVEKKGIKDTLTVGFIGAGNFAEASILPTLRKNRYVRLGGVAMRSGMKAHHVAKKWSFRYATTDPNSILNDPEIDTVFIVTRHDSHGRYVVEALSRKKNVFVEKPLALSHSELEEVRRAFQDAGTHLMVGFNRRFAPFTQRLKEFFRSRKHPVMLDYRVNAGPLPLGHWAIDPNEGGDRIRGEVCHFIDLAQYIVGQPPVKVLAQPIVSDQSELIPQSVVVSLTYLDGSIATIRYTSDGNRSFGRERLEAFCDQGVAVLDNFKRLELWRGRKGSRHWRLSRDMGHQAELETFIDAVRLGKSMLIPFSELYTTTEITFRILDSMKQGESLTIPTFQS
jgi:predicted dehydrogenase/threonine dehydrogenase-like Zn-dependent dehydrogenase